MSESFQLSQNTEQTFNEPFGKGDKLTISSNAPPPGNTSGDTGIYIFDNEKKNVLFHVRFSPEGDFFIINSRVGDNKWGLETLLNISPYLSSDHSFKFTIEDHGSIYILRFNNEPTVRFQKRDGLAKHPGQVISYTTTGVSYLSNPVKVEVNASA